MEPGLYSCIGCDYQNDFGGHFYEQLFVDPIVQAILEQQRAGNLLLHLL